VKFDRLRTNFADKQATENRAWFADIVIRRMTISAR